jgi:hypothetical protein
MDHFRSATSMVSSFHTTVAGFGASTWTEPGTGRESDAIAVHRLYKDRHSEIEVFDLPSGRRRFLHALPSQSKRIWRGLSEWKGDRIYVWARERIPGTRTDQEFLFSTSVRTDGLGEPRPEPEFNGYSDGDRFQFSAIYGDRLVQVTINPLDEKPSWLRDVLTWFDGKLSTEWGRPTYGPMRLQFFDRATGQRRYELSSSRIRDHGWMGGLTGQDGGYAIKGISPDGRRVANTAVVDQKMYLMMWDADPPPRWPWAIGAGIAAVAAVRFLPRLRRRRPIHQAVGQSSPATACGQ